MKTKKSEVRLESLDRQFKKLINSQFEYTTDTERNFNVKHNISADVWTMFAVLVESDEFDDETKTIITRTLRQEILRRRSLV
jgi:queuine/archaeosine tRNA-ribosyltransferase